MKHSRLPLVLFMLLGAIYPAVALAQASNTCGNQVEKGDIYPCCSNGGNCTWWAWKEAKDFWGVSLLNWGSANQWASNLEGSGYSLSPVPSVNTIAVSTNHDHVAWVTSVNYSAMTLEVSEMNCGYYPGNVDAAPYSFSFFENGFVFPKSSNPSPSLTGISANPTHSSNNQVLTVYGTNFPTQFVYVTFPSGGHAVLTGSGQIPFYSPTYMDLNMTFGASGTWTVQAESSTGELSNPYSFWVY